MNRNIPKHFSNNFRLNIDKLPSKESDRLNLYILLPGLVLGAALFCLGLFEFINGSNNSQPLFDKLMLDAGAEYDSFVSPWFFDAVLMLLGAGIVISLFLSHLRYKKIYFDGKSVTMIQRPAIGKKKTFRENIQNYDGVMLRIEFFQCGFMNKNKYIIELYHKNPKKIVPLYISTSENNVRKIWEDYARKLNLPTMIYTDEGLVRREVADLNKTLREMSEVWDLKKKFNENTKPSSCVAVTRKPDKTIIKTRKIIWDAYNLIAWFFIFIFVIVGFIVSFGAQNFSVPALTAFYAVEVIGLTTAVFVLFRKDKLVVKRDKIVNTYKYMLFSIKHDEIRKDEIESVDVTFNPATERYFVAIISDNKTIIYGKKLPISDLKWVKKFLINEIVKD